MIENVKLLLLIGCFVLCVQSSAAPVPAKYRSKAPTTYRTTSGRWKGYEHVLLYRLAPPPAEPWQYLMRASFDGVFVQDRVVSQWEFERMRKDRR